MEIEKLAERLVGLRFESGHFFENGTSFYETLSKDSLRACSERSIRRATFYPGRTCLHHPSPPTTVSTTTCTSRRPRPHSRSLS